MPGRVGSLGRYGGARSRGWPRGGARRWRAHTPSSARVSRALMMSRERRMAGVDGGRGWRTARRRGQRGPDGGDAPRPATERIQRLLLNGNGRERGAQCVSSWRWTEKREIDERARARLGTGRNGGGGDGRWKSAMSLSMMSGQSSLQGRVGTQARRGQQARPPQARKARRGQVPRKQLRRPTPPWLAAGDVRSGRGARGRYRV